MKMHCDAIVVGLGPSGAHFSYLASKLGYKVIAIEKEHVGRPKICAGGISPLSARILRGCYGAFPSEIVERKVSGIELTTHKNKYSLELPEIEAFTTRRSSFDGWLVKQAMDKGAIVREQCDLKRVQFSKESVHVEVREQGSDSEIIADCMIGAYGVTSLVPKIIGINAPETVTGVQSELELPQGKVEDSYGNVLRFFYDGRFSRFGYAWIFPKGGSISVGVLDKNPEHLIERLGFFIKTNSALSGMFDYFRMHKTKTRAALIPNETLAKSYRDRCILIGDAAGFGDRITWEGISYALRSADCAVKAFDSAQQANDFSLQILEKYQQLCEASFGKDMRYGKKLQKLMFGEDLDSTWSRVVDFLNEKGELADFLMKEMQKHMSIATALVCLPKKQKLSLLKGVGFRKGLTFLAREAINIG